MKKLIANLNWRKIILSSMLIGGLIAGTNLSTLNSTANGPVCSNSPCGGECRTVVKDGNPVCYSSCGLYNCM